MGGDKDKATKQVCGRNWWGVRGGACLIIYLVSCVCLSSTSPA
jgi:hypothetical protein